MAPRYACGDCGALLDVRYLAVGEGEAARLCGGRGNSGNSGESDA